MIRFNILFFIILILCPKISFSHNFLIIHGDSLKTDSGYVSSIDVIEYDINKSLSDGYEILRSPINSSACEWITAGAVLSTVPLSMLLDDEIRSTVRAHQTNSMDNFTKIGKFYGEVIPAVSISAGLYAAGLIINERSVSLTGRLLGESLFYVGVVGSLLKFILSRSRPYTNNGNADFWNFKFDNDFYSMPSGHSTVAFTISTVLAKRIDNIYATIGLYSLASFTAYQRIYSDNHWFSDTVLGAIIGYAIGNAVVNLNEIDKFENDGLHYSLTPAFYKDGIGLSANLVF
jgi:PAP2 superfamily